MGETVEFYLMIDGEWKKYDNDDNELWRMAIKPHSGVWVRHRKPITIVGEPVSGESITLPAGKHLLGFPEVPSAYSTFADLLIDGVESIQWNVPTQGGWVVYTIPRQKLDDYIEAGKAIVITTSKEVTFDLRKQAPAAPSAHNRLTMTWGALKNNR